MDCRYVVPGVRPPINHCRSALMDESAPASAQQKWELFLTKIRAFRCQGTAIPLDYRKAAKD